MFYTTPGVFFHSRVTGACPVTTDLIMRVDVRATNNNKSNSNNNKNKDKTRTRTRTIPSV